MSEGEMDSQPWRQGERVDPDDNENDEFDDSETMSFTVFTNRVPDLRPTAADDLPASTTTAAIATATQGEDVEGEDSEAAEEAGTADATTYASPLRIASTTVELSTGTNTGVFTTPLRASAESASTGTADSDAATLALSAPSTFRTSASSSPSGSLTDSSSASLASGVPQTGAENTALPDVSPTHKHSMSNGEIAAAVIMPILAAVAIFALLFLCRRRRRSRNTPPQPFFSSVMDKMNQFRPRATSPSTIDEPPMSLAAAAAAPIVTNPSNNAYYTGLDTSSHGSRPSDSQEYYAPRSSEGGTFADPPPPYHDGKPPPQLPAHEAVGGEALVGVAAGVPHLQEPEPAMRTRSPFEDPVSPLEGGNTHAMGGILLSPVERPAISRSSTVSRAPSFSSTQYSDTASVHSARAARRSVGGPQVIVSSSPPLTRGSISPIATRNEVESEDEEMMTPTATQQGSVFDDPASPISSIASMEFHDARGDM